MSSGDFSFAFFSVLGVTVKQAGFIGVCVLWSVKPNAGMASSKSGRVTA